MFNEYFEYFIEKHFPLNIRKIQIKKFIKINGIYVPMALARNFSCSLITRKSDINVGMIVVIRVNVIACL